MCFGLLERTPQGFFDTALLFTPAGEIVLHYRKISEQPPFKLGETVTSADTTLGRLGLLICGDVFHPQVTARLAPDLKLLLVPMARSFETTSPDPKRWQSEERQVYLEAARATGHTTVFVNALEVETTSASFGGALAVAADGTPLAESPHGTDAMVTLEL